MNDNNFECRQKKDDCTDQNDNINEILKDCGIQYWTYNPVNDEGISGLNAMTELGVLKSWDNFPQGLIDMGLIHKNSVKEWLHIHERIKLGEKHIISEIQVVEQGITIWKKIQYHTKFDEYGNPVKAIGTAENISAYRGLAENYARAAKQCGVTLWTLDLASKTIYGLSNASRIKVFDNVRVIRNVPEVFEDGRILHPDDLPVYAEMLNRIFEGEKTVKSVGRWWNEECKVWLWYETSYTVILDETGKSTKAIGTAIDITERVRLEERYSEEIKWRKVHNKDILGSFKLNLTKNICEDGMSEIPTILTFQGNGTVDDFFTHEYTAHVDLNDLEEYKKMFNRESLLNAYRTGKTNVAQETYMNFGGDKILWTKIELDMFVNPQSGDVEAYIYATDIDQKKTAQDLVDTVVVMDYDYLALIDSSNDSYTLFAQTDGKTALPPRSASNYENEVKAYATKYLVKEDIERNISEMSYKNVFSKLEEQQIYTIYCRVKERTGKISRKKLRFSYLDQKRGKIILTRSDITDIYNEGQSKNQMLKDALLAAQQANNAKSEFLSRMSHEIRTPMNAIIGMATLAAGCVNNPDQVSEYLSKVGISARFLLTLINDILDMSRIESGKLLIRKEEIPFEAFINNINGICHGQAQEKGVAYDAIVTSFTEDIYIGDATKLQQILVNIIANAIKFTPPGGKVQFVVNQETINRKEALMKFTINDTGIGISDSFIPRLFEPFEQQSVGATTPYGGTGLGLAICRSLVELMGGKIKVNSIEGIGSEFIIEVKLGISEKSRETGKLKANTHFENLKALIVDDDIIICQHTKEIMSDMHMKAEYVVKGAKAIELVRSKWKKKEFYDIILIDWKMPEMNGIETTREIRKIVGAEVTIIIMTAYDWAIIETEAKLAGVNLLISKPIFMSSLSSAFEKIYEGKEIKLKKEASTEYDFAGKRVLLVEDHILNIEVAKKLLNGKNLDVDVAENGLRAIEIFAQKGEGYYDAILMDIRMPVMDGLTAAQSIRQMRKADAKKIPIIAMTANAFDEDIEKTKAAGMDAHLAKPIEPLLLYQTMQRFFNRGE